MPSCRPAGACVRLYAHAAGHKWLQTTHERSNATLLKGTRECAPMSRNNCETLGRNTLPDDTGMKDSIPHPDTIEDWACARTLNNALQLSASGSQTMVCCARVVAGCAKQVHRSVRCMPSDMNLTLRRKCCMRTKPTNT